MYVSQDVCHASVCVQGTSPNGFFSCFKSFLLEEGEKHFRRDVIFLSLLYGETSNIRTPVTSTKTFSLCFKSGVLGSVYFPAISRQVLHPRALKQHIRTHFCKHFSNAAVTCHVRLLVSAQDTELNHGWSNYLPFPKVLSRLSHPMFLV